MTEIVVIIAFGSEFLIFISFYHVNIDKRKEKNK